MDVEHGRCGTSIQHLRNGGIERPDRRLASVSDVATSNLVYAFDQTCRWAGWHSKQRTVNAVASPQFQARRAGG